MRIVVAALATLAPSPASGDAARRVMRRSGTSTPRRRCDSPPAVQRHPTPTSDYIVRDANQLPVGSSIWWDQMLRENRAGTCCN